jgi:hypothetical protein
MSHVILYDCTYVCIVRTYLRMYECMYVMNVRVYVCTVSKYVRVYILYITYVMHVLSTSRGPYVRISVCTYLSTYVGICVRYCVVM